MIGKKGGTRKSTMRWKAIEPSDAKIGDYVLGRTWTNSQKYGDDYNFTAIGTVIEESNESHNIQIKTSKGKIKFLTAFVGTSGGNEIYKAVDKRLPSGIFKHLLDRQLTNKNRKLNSSQNSSQNSSPNNSIASSNASSIIPSSNNSRSRSRSRSRSTSRSSSRSRGGKSKTKKQKNNKNKNDNIKKKNIAYGL